MPQETIDAIELLITDHREVDALFDAFEKARNDEAKAEIVARVCTALSVHTTIEEEIFYPRSRATMGQAEADQVDESLVEHFLAKTLIGKLRNMKPGDDGYDATFQVLSEIVRHHVEEEEEELFPDVRKTKLDLLALGGELLEKKVQLMNTIIEATAKQSAA
jgi:hemerythrin superfamily protein